MDIARAIKFPFEDDDWPVKILLGALISFVPFFSQGFQVRVARNVIRGRKHPLPGTDELGQVFVDGIMATLAGMLYFLPVALVGCVIVLPAAIIDDSGGGGLASCGALCCVVMLIILYVIPVLAVYSMGVIRYAETGNFSEFLRLGALWRDVRENLPTLLMLLVYSLALGVLGTLLTFTVILAPFVGFLYQIVSGHLLGQAGLEIQDAY